MCMFLFSNDFFFVNLIFHLVQHNIFVLLLQTSFLRLRIDKVNVILWRVIFMMKRQNPLENVLKTEQNI